MMHWHTFSLSDVERELGTNAHEGLSEASARMRLAQFGPNVLPAPRTETLPAIFLRQFKSPFIYMLLLASVVVFFLQEPIDAAVILVVLIFNAVIGTLQEGKAQNTLLALQRFAETYATVLRDGEETILPAARLVPGDVIILQEGEKIPADARIAESNNLKVEEAALTGESVPVHKQELTLPEEKLPLSHHVNMVFKGTHVVGGNGKAVVVATGAETAIGKISTTIAGIDTEIPLTRDIRALSRIIIIATLLVSAVLFVFGIAIGKMPAEMLRTVVSLAVSIIPEGLPVVLTLILAMGVSRMAKRNALVKKLHAVEALGQAKIIAVDKTGTLTRNEMIVRKVYMSGVTFDIGGVGYEPKGEVRLGDMVIDAPNHPELILAGKIAALCASAHVALVKDAKPGDGELKQWRVSGDPTEAALLVLGEKLGFHKIDLEREAPLLAEAPFEYATRYHATSHRVDGKEFVTVAGAPEAVFALAKSVFTNGKIQPLSAGTREEFERTFHHMSQGGLRIVAFAFEETPLAKAANEPLRMKNLVLAGLYGMADSLRPEVPDAVRRAREAGMRVVMITGDHKLTAVAIAKEAGIWREHDIVVTDEDVEQLSREDLAARFERASVFARITPEHKMKIIEAYKERGEIIAMTGDGVNDAPSLVAADLGVAMGRIGTEVAKEAADIVLLDDNFGSIVSAIEEGRSMYKTIAKAILYLFSTSMGEVLSIAGALFLNLPLPVLPAQILWLNLITDPFMGSALALEPKEEGLLRKSFRPPARHFIDRLMLIRIAVMALTMTAGTLIVFGSYLHDLPKAWTMALTVLAVFQWFNAWNCRSEDTSLFATNPFSNPSLVAATFGVVALQIAAVSVPFLQGILRTVPLTLGEWGITIAVGSTIVLTEELRKLLMKKEERPRVPVV